MYYCCPLFSHAIRLLKGSPVTYENVLIGLGLYLLAGFLMPAVLFDDEENESPTIKERVLWLYYISKNIILGLIGLPFYHDEVLPLNRNTPPKKEKRP